jgi:bacteriochlorophyll 4-vinyl reductase
MNEVPVGRLLAASLHQGIAELLPMRLEYYEEWLRPGGLREGRIGLGPLLAVLSFLRLEGEAYGHVAARAGERTAEWTVASLSRLRRRLIGRAPSVVRKRLVMGLAREMVRNTHGATQLKVSWRRWLATVELRNSLFCDVRARVDRPLCVFYAAALARLLELFDLDVQVRPTECRAAGADRCALSVTLRRRSTRQEPAEARFRSA